jgi:hypothetical protein
VLFGEVVAGESVLKLIEEAGSPLAEEGKPTCDVIIADCGEPALHNNRPGHSLHSITVGWVSRVGIFEGELPATDTEPEPES